MHVWAHDDTLYWFLSSYRSTPDEYSPRRKVSESAFCSLSVRHLRQEGFNPSGFAPHFDIIVYESVPPSARFLSQTLFCSSRAVPAVLSQNLHVSPLLEQSTFPPIESEGGWAPAQRHTKGDQGRWVVRHAVPLTFLPSYAVSKVSERRRHTLNRGTIGIVLGNEWRSIPELWPQNSFRPVGIIVCFFSRAGSQVLPVTSVF